VRANTVCTGVAPDVPAMCGDDVRVEVYANTHAFAVFGIHPTVVCHPEEFCEDTLTELRRNA